MNNFFLLMPFKRLLNFAIILVTSVVLLSSCYTSARTSNYFKAITKDTTIQAFVTENLEPKIRKGDFLAIDITSLNPSEDVLYNSATITTQTKAGGGDNGKPGFYVDKDGNIEMHKLGVLHIEGMTLKQVEAKLKKDLAIYLKDPIATVNFQNHRIMVFGAVASSQQIQLDKTEKISILDALVASGNITEEGDKSNVLIIRDTEKGKQMTHVNLEDHSIFSSPWFYLHSDDVVYVSTVDNKKANENTQKRQQTLNNISLGVSFALLIYTTFIRK